jgi:2,4-dienoyl-CoA reductase-like NADH-dependent reductase (Old Yellow Enzyme family)
MAEHEADSNMLPSAAHVRSYSTWAKGGWGMVMTGEADEEYLAKAYGTATEHHRQAT